MMPWKRFQVFLACVLLDTIVDKVSATPVRLSFDAFFLDFLNLEECGDNAWETTEFVRSGAEDCLRATPCPDWVDQPSFIGLGNIACVDGQAEFQGGVLKFDTSDEIPDDIEACVRRVLTSEDCLPIFQGHWSEVEETPIYQSDRFPLYPGSGLEDSIEIDTVRPVQETESAITKEQALPIVPMAAACGGGLLLVFLSTFIVYRKKRIQNGQGFHNLGSKKSVPITPITVHSETEDMENGALSQRDSLSPLTKKRSSTTLEDMLGRVSVTSVNDDDDCGVTPETMATAKISSHLGSTFSDDEDDNRQNGPQLRVAPSPNPYDTRLVIEDSDDDESYPVISIHSQDEESTNRFVASPQPPVSSSAQPQLLSVQSRILTFGNATSIKVGEHSIEDPELVFFNDKPYDPDAFLGERESVVELFSESSSCESDARDFDMDHDWDPDDASVTTNDEVGLALNGTGEFSFHAGIDDDDPFSPSASTPPRGLLDWSLDDIPEFHKASTSSLPTLLEESHTVKEGRQRSFSLATTSKDSWS